MVRLVAWLALSLTASTLVAAPAEVRGTWLTTTGVDHIRSGFQTEASLAALRQTGLNTAYVETWKNGYTNYPSQALASFTRGPDRNRPVIGSSRDLVEETLIHAHRNQMAYIGWYEYGFASQFIGNVATIASPNPLTARALSEGWLLRDQDGRFGNSSNSFAWMNPAVPEVRQFLIDITLEAVDRYDLDGIQFDDRLAWPREFGWDATTEALYLADTGNALPTNANDAAFRTWRQDQVTRFAEELSAAVRSARPNVIVSVSPSITNFSDVNFNAEWPAWQNDGLFDEYAVQVYRDNFAAFNSALSGQTAQFSPVERGAEFVVGLRGNGGGANTPYADLELMIERSREIGAAGHSIFFSQALINDYPAELTALYNVAGEGQAPHPTLGAGWRPAPVVAQPTGGQWEVNVTQPSRYRVVAKIGSFWEEVSTGPFAAGASLLSVPGATQVELLLDRRPLDTADFNGDGLVDAIDYALWRETRGSTLDLRADANGDGLVDGIDLAAWRADYGSTVAQPIATPEPRAFVLVMASLVMLARRRCSRSL